MAHLSRVDRQEAIWVRTRSGPVEVERQYTTVITDAGRVVAGHRPISEGSDEQDHTGSDSGNDQGHSEERVPR
jgi:hypothetical protein